MECPYKKEVISLLIVYLHKDIVNLVTDHIEFLQDFSLIIDDNNTQISQEAQFSKIKKCTFKKLKKVHSDYIDCPSINRYYLKNIYIDSIFPYNFETSKWEYTDLFSRYSKWIQSHGYKTKYTYVQCAKKKNERIDICIDVTRGDYSIEFETDFDEEAHIIM
jgi:hypothetical protein